MKALVHKLMSDGRVLCCDAKVSHASTLDKDVTCGHCKAMLATAAEAKGLRRHPEMLP